MDPVSRSTDCEECHHADALSVSTCMSRYYTYSPIVHHVMIQITMLGISAVQASYGLVYQMYLYLILLFLLFQKCCSQLFTSASVVIPQKQFDRVS